MQVALLSEVMRGSASQDAQPSSTSRTAVVSEDFAAILSRRTESASVRENDNAFLERAPAAAVGADGETKRAESDRDRDVSNAEDSAKDPRDAAENSWLAYSVSNPTEQVHAKAATGASDSDALTRALQAAAEDGGNNASAFEQQASASLAQLAASAVESGTPASTELMKEVLAAMAGLNGDDANSTAAFVQALESSLKQGKTVSQESLRVLLLGDAAVVNNAGAQSTDSAQDTVDLSALLKSLSLGVSKEESVDATQLGTDPALQTQPVKPVSADADANSVDARLVAAPAPNAATVAAKASASAQTAPTTTATPATIEKVVLDNVLYLTSRGEKTMVVQLSPPSLGDLRIEVSSVKNTLNVSLLSGSPTVRDLLESHALGLRESLARNGIEVASVAVLPALAGHAAGQQYAGHATPDFSHATPAVRPVSAASSDLGAASDERFRRVTPHEGTLNLFV